MSRKVGAIVLAAGFSKRFAGSKMLAKLESGNTVFQQTIERIGTALPLNIVVSRAEIAPLLAPYHSNIHLFDAADQGMGASLAFAAGLIEDWDACLVCLADMPFIEVDTYQKIAERSEQHPIVIPCYAGKAGNPVAFSKQYFESLRSLQGDSGGKQLARSHSEDVFDFPVTDPGILQDIDTDEDLKKFQKIDQG